MLQVSKVEHLREGLKRRILDGELAFGQKVPSIRKLATQFSVSPVTTSLVMAELRSEGFVTTRRGRGTFVSYKENQGKLNKDAKRTYNIGLAYLKRYNTYLDAPSVNAHPLFFEWMHGIQDCFGPEYVSIKPLCYTKKHLLESDSVIKKTLENHQIDGLFVAGPLTSEEAIALEQFNIPFVNVSNLLLDRPIPRVTVSILPGFKSIVEHLLDLGHRQDVNLLVYRNDQVIYGDGGRAYVNMAHSSGLKFSTDNIVIVEEDDEGNVPNYNHYIEKAMANNPSAIIVEDEVIANRVVTYCMKKGLKIPEDLSIASFSNINPSTHVIRFTCLSSSEAWRECSRLGCELLQQAIEGGTVRKETIRVMPRLIPGESTSSCRRTQKSAKVDASVKSLERPVF